MNDSVRLTGECKDLSIFYLRSLGECECVCYSAWKDVGVKVGFVGCVESLQINSSQTTVTFDLTDDSSHNVLHKVNIGSLFISIMCYQSF